MVGIPLVGLSAVLVPAAHRGPAWRALDSGAYPWLPATAAMMWGFVIITCTVISWVIYGLRVEVREARRLGQYVREQNDSGCSRVASRPDSGRVSSRSRSTGPASNLAHPKVRDLTGLEVLENRRGCDATRRACFLR